MGNPHSVRCVALAFFYTLITFANYVLLRFFRRLYAHPGSSHCPVQMTLKYFQFLGEHTGSVIPACKPGNRDAPHPTNAIGYSNASQDLQYVLGLSGINGKGFSEHSMKRGGATEAAKCGASREEIQQFGHWKSARTVDKYIEDSRLRQRIFVNYLAQ
jgi:hypothetical protein